MNTTTSDKFGNIRQRIRYATLSKDERILREEGILSENGNLTETGGRVLMDVLFNEEGNRKAVVALVSKVRKAKKEDKDGE